MISLYDELLELKKENNDNDKFLEFSAKLIPNIDKQTIIGIKIPVLRLYAKELYKNNINKCIEFVNSLPHKYLEENIIHGFLVSLLCSDIHELFDYLDKFLPYVNNWSVTDTINSKMFKKHPELVRDKLKEYLKNEKPFVKRFAIVSYLQYFLDDNFREEDLILISKVDCNDYYVDMAKAWYYSFAFIKKYDITLNMFIDNKLNLTKFVYNKSIQKACESFRIEEEKKKYLKSLKI